MLTSRGELEIGSRTDRVHTSDGSLSSRAIHEVDFFWLCGFTDFGLLLPRCSILRGQGYAKRAKDLHAMVRTVVRHAPSPMRLILKELVHSRHRLVCNAYSTRFLRLIARARTLPLRRCPDRCEHSPDFIVLKKKNASRALTSSGLQRPGRTPPGTHEKLALHFSLEKLRFPSETSHIRERMYPT